MIQNLLFIWNSNIYTDLSSSNIAHTILFKSISWKKKKRKHWVNSMKVTRVQNPPKCRLTSFPKAQIDVPDREKTACTEVHRRKWVWQKPDCKWMEKTCSKWKKNFRFSTILNRKTNEEKVSEEARNKTIKIINIKDFEILSNDYINPTISKLIIKYIYKSMFFIKTMFFQNVVTKSCLTLLGYHGV